MSQLQQRGLFANIGIMLTSVTNVAVTSAEALNVVANTVKTGAEGLEFYSKEFKASAEYDYSVSQHQLDVKKNEFAKQLEALKV